MSDPIGRMYARQVAALAAIAGPVVPPRPRVSEHTDAARLEATRDAIRTGTAPRPRVEGEAENLSLLTDDETRRAIATAPHGADLAILTALTADRNHWRNGYDQLQKSFDDLWARLNAELAHTTRLTAEVERLRGIALNLSAAWYYGGWKYETINEREMQSLMEQAGYWPTTEEQIIERRAALALPTPAPEEKDGK